MNNNDVIGKPKWTALSIAKKVGLLIAAVVIWFIPSLIVGTFVSMANPSCITCGMSVTTTLWFIGVVGLQPVIWTRQLDVKSRLLAGCIALIVGIAVYFGIEFIAGVLFGIGMFSAGLTTGFFANIVAEIIAFVVCLKLVKKYRLSS